MPCEDGIGQQNGPIDTEGQGLPQRLLCLGRTHGEDRYGASFLCLEVNGKLDGPPVVGVHDPLGPVPVDLEGIPCPLEDGFPGDLFDADHP